MHIIYRLISILLLIGACLALLPGMPAGAAGEQVAWDDRFGVPGIYDGDIEAAAVAANGDLFVGGAFQGDEFSGWTNNIARWDGRRWHNLGDGVSGGLTRIRAIATHGTNVYVAGDFTHAGGIAARQIARWDGTVWHALGNGAGPQIEEHGSTRDGSILALAVGANGDLFVGGIFTHIDGVPANSVARWDGAGWHNLGAGIVDRGVLGGDELFPAYVYALAVASDGSLYAGGQFSDAGAVSGRNVARWNGTSWSALGSGVRGGDMFDGNQVRALAVDGGKLYVGGSFTQAGDANAANIAVWDGADWQALGSGLTSDLGSPAPVLRLLAQDGSLYAGGAFTNAGGRAIAGLARWNGTEWSAVGAALEATGFRVVVRALVGAPSGGIFAGGAFERVGGRTVNGIAHWDGAAWHNLGDGVTLFGDASAVVQAVAVDTAGRIYVGGLITHAGGLPVNNIAMWDGTRWHDLGGGVTTGPDGVVAALLVVGDNLYVGGRFTQAGGKSAARIARWHIPTRTWSAVGTGFDGEVMALAYGGGMLYAGGSFAQAGGVTARDVAAWDGRSWAALGGDWEVFEVLDTGNEAGTFVRSLAYNNGELFIGGHFKTVHRKGAGTQDPTSYWYVHNIVGYMPARQEWFALGPDGAAGVTTNGFSGIDTTVYALAIANGDLYIGGTFNRGGGILTPALARWNLGSGVWSSPGAFAAQETPIVRSLSARGGRLLVGGAFTSIGDLPVRSAALLATTTGRWNDLGGGMRWRNGVARVNAALLQSDAALLGGEFSLAGDVPAVGFARAAGDFGGDPPPIGNYRIYLPTVRR